MYDVLDRISSVDGHLATIKYIGTLAESAWGTEMLAIGVEWDEPERGKNDGEINGVRYFKPMIERSASFIKYNSKKISPKRYSLVKVLKETYSSQVDENDLEIQFGSKHVESFGFNDLNAIQSDFNNLQSISLERKYIFTLSKIGEDSSCLKDLKNLQELNLGFNLFNNTDIIWNVLEYCPRLTSLNLNGNRFYSISKPSKTFLNVRNLLLANTNLPIEALFQVYLPAFPKLEVLCISGNRYTDSDFQHHHISGSKLRSLDLSYNYFTRIPEAFCNLYSLEELNISHNHVNDILGISAELRRLDLSHNSIDAWETIDRISFLFPKLKYLRVWSNPIFCNSSFDEVICNLVGRLDCIMKHRPGDGINYLEGIQLSKNEIESNELLFISKVRQEIIDFDCNTARWKKLIKKYSIDEVPIQTKDSNGQNNNLVYKKICLRLNLPEEVVERTFLIDNTILRLKGIISKILNCTVLDFRIYYNVNSRRGPENKVYLERYLTTIGSYDLKQNENIYVEI